MAESVSQAVTAGLSEVGGMVSLRRGLLTFLCGVSLASALVIAHPFLWTSGSPTALLAGASIATLILGIGGWRRSWGLWSLSAAMLLASAAALVATTPTRPWFAVLTVVPPLLQVMATMTRRWWGLVFVVVVPALIMGMRAARPDVVDPGALVVGGGLPIAIALALGGIVVHYAWSISIGEGLAIDAQHARVRERAAASYRLNERLALWRSTSKQLHETVLNTNHYLLQADALDTDLLSRQVADLRRRQVSASDDANEAALATLSSAFAKEPAHTGMSLYARARFFVTAPLAGQTASVSLFAIAAWPLAQDLGARVSMVVAVIAVSMGLVLVLRRRELSPPATVLLIGLTLAYPLWLLAHPVSCLAPQAPIQIFLYCSYAVLVVSAWSRPWAGAVAIPVVLVVTFAIVATTPVACRAAVGLVPFRFGLLLAPLVGATYVATRLLGRVAAWAAESEARATAERVRLEASRDLNAQLDASVREAISLYEQAAEAGRMDAPLRRRLLILDAILRSALQVDPGTSGGFARLGADLVRTAGADDVPIDVRALSGSTDPRPVPPALREALGRVVVADREQAPVLTTFSDGQRDYLSLRTTPRALAGVDLEGEDGVRVDVEPDESNTARAVVLLSRSIVDAG